MDNSEYLIFEPSIVVQRLYFVTMRFRSILKAHLIEARLIGTEEGPLDVAVTEADVEDLAVDGDVGVVAVRLPDAAERQVGRNFGQVLARRDPEADHGYH